MMIMMMMSDEGAGLPDEVSEDRGGPVGVLPGFSFEKASTNISKTKNKH